MNIPLPLRVLLLTVAFFTLPTTSYAQTGSWNVTLSPSSGGAKTTISLFATGDFVTGRPMTANGTVGGIGIGFSGLFGSPGGAWTMATTNFTVASMGYVTNTTTSDSRELTGFAFDNSASILALSLLYDSTWEMVTGQTNAFVFDTSPTIVELDLVFSNFTPGTYNGTAGDAQLNMEVVPEPSTYALLTLSAAGLGGYALRRRRR